MRNPKRYELSLNAWKARSRIELLTAKLASAQGSNPELESQLRRAVEDQFESEVRQQTFERDQAEERLKKLKENLDRLESRRDSLIESRYKAAVKKGQRARQRNENASAAKRNPKAKTDSKSQRQDQVKLNTGKRRRFSHDHHEGGTPAMNRRFSFAALAAALVLATAALTNGENAAAISHPASLRYASDDGAQVPDFQRHILPLMGRLGCNSRSCHGSFQGRGGFRLSLFGYDFKADYDALFAKKSGRVDRENPEMSKILQKPTLSIPHKGGKRLSEGTWAYHMILRWIDSGAKRGTPLAVRTPRSNPRRNRLPAPGTDRPAQGGRPLGGRFERRRHVPQPLPHQRRSRGRHRRKRRRHQQGEGRHARRGLLRQRRGRRPGYSARLRQGRAQLSKRAAADQNRRAGRRQAEKAGRHPQRGLHRRRVPPPREPRLDRHAPHAR